MTGLDRMRIHRSLLMVVALMLVANQATWGQVSDNGLISEPLAQRMGLRRQWYLQLPVNPYAEQIIDVDLHVSDTEASWEYEVVLGEERWIFSEFDLNGFRRPMGREVAEQRANDHYLKLQREQKDATLIPHPTPVIRLASMSDQGQVTLLNAETGQVYWKRSLGRRDQVSLGVSTSDRFTVASVGLTIYVLDNKDGTTIWERKAKTIPGGPPAISETTVFVPSIRDRIESFYLFSKDEFPGMYPSPGRVVVKPTVGSTTIAWPTDKGKVYVGLITQPKMRYRLQAHDKIVSRIAYLPPGRYVATSMDGFVYCFQEVSGKVLWHFTTGQPITQSATLLEDSTYVITTENRLYCIDSSSGSGKWFTREISRFIAGSGSRLYCLDTLNRLVVLDMETGGRILTAAVGSLDLVVLNNKTDRMYVGSKSGLLQCLREPKQEYPLIHAGVSERITQGMLNDEEDPAAEPAGKKPPVVKPPAGNNPFAPKNDPGDNPFAPGAKPKPDPKDDPFGADNPFAPGAKPKPDPKDDPFGADDPFKKN
jgi:outer membrane protein assembly factor BamB